MPPLVRSSLLGLALGLVPLAGASADSTDPGGPGTIVLDQTSGFELPAAMTYDADNDRYLVSNIGQGNADDGFVSIVGADGKIEKLKWIAGGADGVELADPKGMAIRGEVLYVADLKAVRKFDLATGRPLGDIPIAGAVALDDVAVTKDGTLFVTDGGVRKSTEGGLYRVDPDGKVTALEHGPQMLNPHGVAVAPDGVVINTTNSAGYIVARSPQGERIGVLTMMINGLDGLLYLPDGRIVVSSWGGRDIVAIETNGNQNVLYNDLETPAGIGFDPKRNRLLVPQLTQNVVRILPLPASGG